MSPINSEHLTDALDLLERNNVHIQNRGSNRMAGFNACTSASSIIVLFLDVMVDVKICKDTPMFLLNPKG